MARRSSYSDAMKELKKASADALSGFKKNSSNKEPLKVKPSSGVPASKRWAGRRSVTPIDLSGPKEAAKAKMNLAHSRQIFDPDMSGRLTKLSNRMANADRLANKGKGAQAMKSPAKKVMYNKFSKKGR